MFIVCYFGDGIMGFVAFLKSGIGFFLKGWNFWGIRMVLIYKKSKYIDVVSFCIGNGRVLGVGKAGVARERPDGAYDVSCCQY